MTLAILIMVSFLVLWQILGTAGLTNRAIRADTAKKIAAELYRLNGPEPRLVIPARRSLVHELDAGRYRAVMRNSELGIERADTAGAVLGVEPE